MNSDDINQVAARVVWAATNTQPEANQTPQQRTTRAGKARGYERAVEKLGLPDRSAFGRLGAAHRFGSATLGIMPTKSSSADMNTVAARILAEATGESPKTAPPPPKNEAAVELGKLGGKKGGAARAASLTPEQRKEIAQKAAAKRWATKQ